MKLVNALDDLIDQGGLRQVLRETFGDGFSSGIATGAFLCWTAFVVAAELYYVPHFLGLIR